MHKLMEYICEELEELERKADKEGKLSMAEIEYAEKLSGIKKNILKAEEMWEDSEYSMEGGSNARGGNSYEGGSYARGGGRGRGRNVRRDSMGRYSSRGGSYEGGSNRGGSYERGYSREDAKEELAMQLREMEQDADEETKHMIKKWIKQLEQD